ncbi:TetR/AcrR family transcriptional regulator [Mycobacterium riyadhense]|uniref:Putative DNA-binding transcriptional regulator n=1 Tax=Mycobacterium riyadhense TaxID=486698 RepID=A0A653EYR8_9MYCO|nr:TetR family transcriptional regulator [Mycobacterium riyadhense]VTP01876.1 putative DNA-binding transcriptional regulator [Mycobacterium riyadhense]
MTTPTLARAPELSHEQQTRARIRDAAIQQFGRHGFDTDLSAVAEAAGADVALLIHEFGSREGLRKACDEYIVESIRSAKTEALQSMSPATWFAQLAQIESYAPMMNYLVRSMLSGGDLGRALMAQMIDNAEGYLEDAVRTGTIKPSRDPKARAAFLAMTGGGGFLLYLHMHDNPTDMAAVLRDYAKDMILPALEIYTHGLLTDTTMYDSFVAREQAPEAQPVD